MEQPNASSIHLQAPAALFEWRSVSRWRFTGALVCSFPPNKKKEAANQILYADSMLRQCDEVRQESESALHDCEVICQDIVNPMLKRSTRAVTLMNMADSNEFGALMAYNLNWRSKVVCTNNYQTL